MPSRSSQHVMGSADKLFDNVIPHFSDIFPDEETFLFFAVSVVVVTVFAALVLSKFITIKSRDPTEAVVLKHIKRE
jgi:NhaP-type Na+/H+ or K+/H+ antiporter